MEEKKDSGPFDNEKIRKQLDKVLLKMKYDKAVADYMLDITGMVPDPGSFDKFKTIYEATGGKSGVLPKMVIKHPYAAKGTRLHFPLKDEASTPGAKVDFAIADQLIKDYTMADINTVLGIPPRYIGGVDPYDKGDNPSPKRQAVFVQGRQAGKTNAMEKYLDYMKKTGIAIMGNSPNQQDFSWPVMDQYKASGAARWKLEKELSRMGSADEVLTHIHEVVDGFRKAAEEMVAVQLPEGEIDIHFTFDDGMTSHLSSYSFFREDPNLCKAFAAVLNGGTYTKPDLGASLKETIKRQAEYTPVPVKKNQPRQPEKLLRDIL